MRHIISRMKIFCYNLRGDCDEKIFNGNSNDGGDKGGEVIASGTPEEVVRVGNSYTGQALKQCVIRNA